MILISTIGFATPRALKRSERHLREAIRSLPIAATQHPARLESQGYRVVRFWNNDVIGNTQGVLAMIKAELAKD